jgi:predicted aspartyl protease
VAVAEAEVQTSETQEMKALLGQVKVKVALAEAETVVLETTAVVLTTFKRQLTAQ